MISHKNRYNRILSFEIALIYILYSRLLILSPIFQMKFLLLTFVIAVASAAPHWDQTGKYKVIDEEAVKVIEEPIKVVEAPAKVKVIEAPVKVIETPVKVSVIEEPALDYFYSYPYYRYYQDLIDPGFAPGYYQNLADPLYARYYQTLTDPFYARYYQSLVEPAYYANLPSALQYKAYSPFVYDYKLVKDIKA